jgi:hypothetical protein
VGTLPTRHPHCRWNPLLWRSSTVAFTLARLHASTAPKMHSFVHGLFPPNPTASHHEPTASTTPSACHQHAIVNLLKHKALSPEWVGYHPGHRGPNGSAVCEGEGERLSTSDASSPGGLLGSLYGAVTTLHTRMDVVL